MFDAQGRARGERYSVGANSNLLRAVHAHPVTWKFGEGPGRSKKSISQLNHTDIAAGTAAPAGSPQCLLISLSLLRCRPVSIHPTEVGSTALSKACSEIRLMLPRTAVSDCLALRTLCVFVMGIYAHVRFAAPLRPRSGRRGTFEWRETTVSACEGWLASSLPSVAGIASSTPNSRARRSRITLSPSAPLIASTLAVATQLSRGRPWLLGGRCGAHQDVRPGLWSSCRQRGRWRRDCHRRRLDRRWQQLRDRR